MPATSDARAAAVFVPDDLGALTSEQVEQVGLQLAVQLTRIIVEMRRRGVAAQPVEYNV